MKTQIPARVTRSRQQARGYYNAISRFYDLLSGGAEGRLRAEAIRRLAIQPGERILEIGTGTGAGLSRLAEAAGSSGRAVGVELADGMLAVARKRIDRRPVRAALVCADGANLPFSADSFDAVFLSFTLELFDSPEIRVVLDECRRVLKSGGRLGIVAMGLSLKPNRISRIYAAMHAAFPVWVDCRPIDARRSAEEAGFAVTETTRKSMFSLPVDIVICRK